MVSTALLMGKGVGYKYNKINKKLFLRCVQRSYLKKAKNFRGKKNREVDVMKNIAS